MLVAIFLGIGVPFAAGRHGVLLYAVFNLVRRPMSGSRGRIYEIPATGSAALYPERDPVRHSTHSPEPGRETPPLNHRHIKDAPLRLPADSYSGYSMSGQSGDLGNVSRIKRFVDNSNLKMGEYL